MRQVFAHWNTPAPGRIRAWLTAAAIALPITLGVVGLVVTAIGAWVTPSLARDPRRDAVTQRCSARTFAEDQVLCDCLDSAQPIRRCLDAWSVTLLGLQATRCRSMTVRERAPAFCACVDALTEAGDLTRYPRCATLDDRLAPPPLDLDQSAR